MNNTPEYRDVQVQIGQQNFRRYKHFLLIIFGKPQVCGLLTQLPLFLYVLHRLPNTKFRRLKCSINCPGVTSSSNSLKSKITTLKFLSLGHLHENMYLHKMTTRPKITSSYPHKSLMFYSATSDITFPNYSRLPFHSQTWQTIPGVP